MKILLKISGSTLLMTLALIGVSNASTFPPPISQFEKKDPVVKQVLEGAEKAMNEKLWGQAESQLREAILRFKNPKLKLLLADAIIFESALRYAVTLVPTDEYKEAIELLRSVADTSNDDEDHAVVAQLKLGTLLENIGRLDEAEYYLRKAADENKHKGACLYLSSFLRLHGKNYDESVYENDWWQRILEQDHLIKAVPLSFLEHLKLDSSDDAGWSPENVPYAFEQLRACYRYQGKITKGDKLLLSMRANKK